ncbi:NADP-dependent oxidoreductase [Emticicia sp. BO119]|uniref:NADP-dependent oxidoreductase n=1 Tax=Emticicia sp. BO119 TaxID=2757768 RepID=UPI0015F1239E|nr:NADP-dependent oxidoreductase [Emticicia sp. BO119]MBA4853201.1 NADP-dependent oxidoreductase [Emticicia sp. BO119]
MKAIVLKAFGSVDNFVVEELPQPTIQDHEVLVAVKAISINPVDMKTRSGKALAGKLKEENPIILGWDISGVITEVGNDVKDFKVGDEIFGMVNFPGSGKAYAEYVAAPAAHLALKPANILLEEAAAATLAALTAWQAFNTYTKINRGDRILIHAAAGGVGHFAVQIAKYFGAYVIGTASAANKDFVLSLGADEHFDYKSKPFEEAISDIDIVLDTVGGNNIERSFEVVKKGGTVITLPSNTSEGIVEKAKAKGVTGFHFMVQSNGEDMKQLADLLEKGIIKPHVSAVYSLDEMGKAHQQIETGSTRGKIVIKP